MRNFILSIFFITLLLAADSVSAANRVGFVNNNIWLSKDAPIQGDDLKIYAIVVNGAEEDVEGDITFYDNNIPIGAAAHFVLPGGTSRVMHASWLAVSGDHVFKSVIANAKSVKANGDKSAISGSITTQTSPVLVDIDSDLDGLPNKEEAASGTDPNKADSDGDGVGDKQDLQPLNPKITGGADTDRDGISDAVDSDMDNDGLYNWEEDKLRTDPKKYDTDGDSASDKEDAYPLDPHQSARAGSIPETSESTSELSAASATDPSAAILNASTSDQAASVSEPDPQRVLGEKVVEDASTTDIASVNRKAIPQIGSEAPAWSFLTSSVILKTLAILSIIFLSASLAFLVLSKVQERRH